MLKSTIVASILVIAAQTASAKFMPVTYGPDEYPSGPVHRSKATASKKKDAEKREIEVKVKAERAEGERGMVLRDLDGDDHGDRNVIIRRIGPGGHGGEGDDRNVIIKRIGPGAQGEEKEMRVRILRDDEGHEGPEGGKPHVKFFEKRIGGEGHGEGHSEGHGEGHRNAELFIMGEPGEHKRIEIEVEGGPHSRHGGGKPEVREFRFEGKLDGHNLPPQVREHIHELIQNHMRHMHGGPRAGHDGGEGRPAPRHAGPRAQRGPRGQGGPGMPGMGGQPGMGMRRMGPGGPGGQGGPGMGGPGMGNFGPRGMGPGIGQGPGMRRMGPGGMGGMNGGPGMGGPGSGGGRRFFNQQVPAPQGGEPGAGAPPAPPAPPAAPAAPGAAGGRGGSGGVNREEMRKMMIERLEKRLEELKKSEGKPQGSLPNPNNFI